MAASRHTRRRSEVVRSSRAQALLRSFLELPTAEQLELYGLIGDHLGAEIADRSLDRALRRAEGLKAMQRVYAHLKLPEGTAPKAREFDRAARELGLDVTARRVGMAFGRWRFAQDVFLGRDEPRQTPEESAIRRALARPGTLSNEERLDGVRAWLKTEPVVLSLSAFSRWRRQENRRRHRSGETMIPGAVATREALALSWPLVVRVARGELSLEDAREQHRRRVLEGGLGGPHDLVGIQEVLELATGSFTISTLHSWIANGSFPVPVVVIQNRRLWIRSDVEAFLDDKPFPSRTENELGNLYFNSEEIARRFGLRADANLVRRLPPPTVHRSRRRLWLRSEVESWGKTLPQKQPRSHS